MDNTETQAPLGTRQNKEKHQTNKPKGKHEWTTQRHSLHWEQDRTKRNTKQINRMGKLEWTTQRHVQALLGTRRNKEKYQTNKQAQKTNRD